MLRLRAAIESASGKTRRGKCRSERSAYLAPSNVNSLLNYGNLEWSWDRKTLRVTLSPRSWT